MRRKDETRHQGRKTRGREESSPATLNPVNDIPCYGWDEEVRVPFLLAAQVSLRGLDCEAPNVSLVDMERKIRMFLGMVPSLDVLPTNLGGLWCCWLHKSGWEQDSSYWHLERTISNSQSLRIYTSWPCKLTNPLCTVLLSFFAIPAQLQTRQEILNLIEKNPSNSSEIIHGWSLRFQMTPKATQFMLC